MASPPSFAEWLRVVDPSGRLNGYEPALEEQCDVVEIGPRYVRHGKAGIEQFFEDVGVVDAHHQQLFSKYFASVAGPAAEEAKGEGTVTQRMTIGLMGSAHQAAVDVSAAAAAIKDANAVVAASAVLPPPTDDGLQDMQAWLCLVDPSGGLDGYLPALEELIDLDDVRSLRAVLAPLLPPDRKKNGPVSAAVGTLLGSRFFSAVGVRDEDHQKQFAENYFLLAPTAAAAGSGAAAAPASSSIAGEAILPPEKAGSSPDCVPASRKAASLSLAEWLQEADPSGGLQGFLPVLEEQLSDVTELEELYVVTSGSPPGRRLDERFYEAMGIDKVGDEAHRRLLSDYVARSG